ncbi:hypothetical protein B0H16DRAFT_1748234 [Mycena metata]|uniref:Uncharacterized protein n=1 Tax=Mycena metata TaxID=1033252 RepID=A0AAD7GMY5_9AGAR|nr:hypothetical protein B0H16DRAFT_1748234 [Mycena metata]
MTSSETIISLVLPEGNFDVADAHHRLEWVWGLRCNHLDDHFETFRDSTLHAILTDRALLVIPHRTLIHDLTNRNSLYKGRTSFEYTIIHLDPTHPTPPHTIVSELPPHIALLTTGAKIFKAWALLTGQECHELRLALIERSKMASPDGQSTW